MDIVHERAAGIDISKRDAKVAVRKPGQRRGTYRTEVKTFGATTVQIRQLISYLSAENVSVIVMEATSDYWKPFYFLMEEEQLPVILVNAKRARNIPGRKTDVNDATWLAELAAHNLLATSFIPPEAIRHLRDLTRARSALVHDRTKVYQRLEKFLESSSIKLSSVASNLTGVSSRHMLDALVAGERDPHVLADLSIRSMRRKIPELVEALEGRFTERHASMVKLHLRHIDMLDEQLNTLNEQISEAMVAFDQACQALRTIPGIGEQSAQVIIAEIGVDMTVFANAAHLASWAGVCSGQNESVGRQRSSHTRGGNVYLRAALGTAALAAIKHKESFLAARYRRLYLRRGGSRALVAIRHTIIVAIWHMLADGEVFKELGPNYYDEHNKDRAKNRAVKELQRLGFEVHLDSSA